MLTTFILLAGDVNEVKSGYGNVIFMGIFILGAMAVGIWWLLR
ncbi:MAG TPA: hypothetical protein VGN72_00715 [Tepidisphaeraceae bacterium]|jgi:hypothetical protein|nr:hypothetical protein [Tepidisphaeraceae bacterium]